MRDLEAQPIEPGCIGDMVVSIVAGLPGTVLVKSATPPLCGLNCIGVAASHMLRFDRLSVKSSLQSEAVEHDRLAARLELARADAAGLGCGDGSFLR